jgi:hypothetical protein
MADAKKAGWFNRIASREDALKTGKDASSAFFVVAAIQAALAFLVGFGILFDAAVYAIGAFFVRRLHSRVAAVILLIVSLIAVGVTLANKAGAKLGGGSNILLAVIVLWAAVRAVEATFKLHGRFSAVEGATEAE